MKKRIFLSIVLILLVVFTSCAYATEEPDVMLISEDAENLEGSAIPEEWRRDVETTGDSNIQIISNSHFMVDENPSLQDTEIDGNLFAVGTNVALNNVIVYGDIFIAGQNITFSNITVYGTAFLAGETINMNNSNFNGNVFSASQTMNFAGVAQDIFAAGENLAINDGSLIAREIFASASTISLNGTIGKNAHIAAEEVIVMDNANIAGTLNYSSTQEASISAESNIGVVEFNKTEEVVEEETTSQISVKSYNVVTIVIKSIFICGFIFLFARGFMEKQKNQNIAAYFGKNTLKGLGWAILIPVVSILFLCTGVTLGLSFAVFALYCIILWVSVPVVSIAITANITANKEYNAWKFYGYSLLISVVLAVLKQIPTLGPIITIIVGLAAMGIIMSSLKNKKAEVENSENVKTEDVK